MQLFQKVNAQKSIKLLCWFQRPSSAIKRILYETVISFNIARPTLDTNKVTIDNQTALE